MNLSNMGNARLAAAAGALVLAGIGLGAPGIAHPHEDGADGKVEKVIILREDGDGAHRGKGDRVRTVHIERDGDHAGGKRRIRTIHVGPGGPLADGKHRIRAFHMGDGARMIDCGGERTEVDEATGGDRERTRILFCGKSDLSAAQRIEKLEKALGRISANEELSAEHKEKATAALREAIERLRATP